MSNRNRKNFLASIVAILACVVGIERASAQYNYGMQYNHKGSSPNRYQYHMQQQQQAYGGMESAGEQEHEEEQEERPRINFGIRLRVPAMKIELPRFNLPKITVTAKIRQPDGPRVIKLPAINLDTSSRVETPENSERRPKQMTTSNHQSDYHGGFDDEAPQQHYNPYPNSPASRVRQQQQHQHQSSYYPRPNYAAAASGTSSYHRANAYRAPQFHQQSNNNRFY